MPAQKPREREGKSARSSRTGTPPTYLSQGYAVLAIEYSWVVQQDVWRLVHWRACDVVSEWGWVGWVVVWRVVWWVGE